MGGGGGVREFAQRKLANALQLTHLPKHINEVLQRKSLKNTLIQQQKHERKSGLTEVIVTAFVLFILCVLSVVLQKYNKGSWT